MNAECLSNGYAAETGPMHETGHMHLAADVQEGIGTESIAVAVSRST